MEQHVHRNGRLLPHLHANSLRIWQAKLEAVWCCSETDVRLKKRILRTLIHEIVVDVDADAGEIILTLHWKGGAHTELRLPRRRRGQNSSQTTKEVVGAVRVLARICSDDLIAGVLNRNDFTDGTWQSMDEGTSDRATKSSRNSLLLRRKAQDGRLDESDRSSRLLGSE